MLSEQQNHDRNCCTRQVPLGTPLSGTVSIEATQSFPAGNMLIPDRQARNMRLTETFHAEMPYHQSSTSSEIGAQAIQFFNTTASFVLIKLYLNISKLGLFVILFLV